MAVCVVVMSLAVYSGSRCTVMSSVGHLFSNYLTNTGDVKIDYNFN